MRMRKDFEKLFSRLKPQNPPAGLFEKIMNRIRKEESLSAARKRLVFLSVGTALSAVVLIPAASALCDGLVQSGFLQFLSLIFSNLNAAAICWQDFCLVLMESLPAANLVAFLTALLTLFCSLKYFAQTLKVVSLAAIANK